MKTFDVHVVQRATIRVSADSEDSAMDKTFALLEDAEDGASFSTEISEVELVQPE